MDLAHEQTIRRAESTCIPKTKGAGISETPLNSNVACYLLNIRLRNINDILTIDSHDRLNNRYHSRGTKISYAVLWWATNWFNAAIHCETPPFYITVYDAKTKLAMIYNFFGKNLIFELYSIYQSKTSAEDVFFDFKCI